MVMDFGTNFAHILMQVMVKFSSHTLSYGAQNRTFPSGYFCGIPYVIPCRDLSFKVWGVPGKLPNIGSHYLVKRTYLVLVAQAVIQASWGGGVMKEDRMDVEPCYPLFSAELESVEALASSQQKFQVSDP